MTLLLIIDSKVLSLVATVVSKKSMFKNSVVPSLGSFNWSEGHLEGYQLDDLWRTSGIPVKLFPAVLAPSAMAWSIQMWLETRIPWLDPAAV